MSSLFRRLGALDAIFHDGFWKSDHHFLLAFHSNFLSVCMVSEIKRFYCKPDMTSSWFICQGLLHAILLDGFWKSKHDFLIAFHSNFLSAMLGYRDNEVLLPTDVIISLPPGSLHVQFQYGFWKSDHDFLIPFHSNFLSVMYGFRDNKVLLHPGYDVIVISPPGALHAISWSPILEGRPIFLLVLHCNHTSIVHHFRFN